MTRSRTLRTVLVVGGMIGGLAPAAADTGCASRGAWRDPVQLYGDEVRFRVLRDGGEVGAHRVVFTPAADGSLVVDSEFSIELKVLMFTAYRYRYASTDVWRDGCLVSVAAAVDDNGKRSSVQAEASDDRLTIVGPGGLRTAETGLYPTNHWHAGVLAAERVLNTITGTVSEVRIVDDGDDWVMVDGVPGPARRYLYTGDLEKAVWYDDADRWVKMRFTAKDGSTIEYVCEQCRRAPSREPS